MLQPSSGSVGGPSHQQMLTGLTEHRLAWGWMLLWQVLWGRRSHLTSLLGWALSGCRVLRAWNSSRACSSWGLLLARPRPLVTVKHLLTLWVRHSTTSWGTSVQTFWWITQPALSSCLSPARWPQHTTPRRNTRRPADRDLIALKTPSQDCHSEVSVFYISARLRAWHFKTGTQFSVNFAIIGKLKC